MKIALLNPPSRMRVIRDYYCSKTSKSTYLFAPVDLLMQSGLLAPDNELAVIDAVAETIDPARCLARLKAFRPEILLGMIGAVTLKQDLAFYAQLKAAIPLCKIILSGEPLLENSEQWLLENDFLDGVLLRFVSKGIAQLARGDKEIEGLVICEGDDIQTYPPSSDPEYFTGKTRQELFQFPRYFFSFAKQRRFATFLSDFGCPFKCGFCVMAQLGYRRRKIDEVEAELDFLNWLHTPELFLADQCFGAHKEHARKLMALFRKYHNSFTAFVRPDQKDPEFWRELKQSGCHTVILGLESASPEILSGYQKGCSPSEMEDGVKKARAAGLRVVTTVIIGLPEDTEQGIRETMKLLRKLQPDFASYNLAVPRSLTGLRQKAIAEGLVDGAEADQAGSFAALGTRSLSPGQLISLKRKAVRDFYFRPGYLLRRLIKVRSGFELYALLREGLAILGKNL